MDKGVIERRLQDRQIDNGIFLFDRTGVGIVGQVSEIDIYLDASDKLANSYLDKLSFIPEYAERGITNLMVVCARRYISILSTNLFSISKENINRQDASGKTALHYLFSHLDNYNIPDMYDMLYFKGADPLIRDNEGNNIFDQVEKSKISTTASDIIANVYHLNEWFKYNKLRDVRVGTLFSTIPKDMIYIISTLLYLDTTLVDEFTFVQKFFDPQLRFDANYILYIINQSSIENKKLFEAFAYLKMTNLVKLYITRFIDLYGIEKFKNLYENKTMAVGSTTCDLLYIAIYNEDIELINFLFSLYPLGFNILAYDLPNDSIVSNYYRKIANDNLIDCMAAATIRNNNDIFNMCIDQYIKVQGSNPGVYNYRNHFIAICNSNLHILNKILNMVHPFQMSMYFTVTLYTPNVPYYKNNYSYFSNSDHLLYCILYGLFDTDIHKISNLAIISTFPLGSASLMPRNFPIKNNLCMARDNILNQFLISPRKNIDGIRFTQIHTMSQFVSYNSQEILTFYLRHNSS